MYYSLRRNPGPNPRSRLQGASPSSRARIFFTSSRLTRRPLRSSAGVKARLNQGNRYESVVSKPLTGGMERSRLSFTASCRMTLATCSAVDSGCENVMSDTSSICAMMKPVSIGPGETAATLMPVPRSSSPNANVKARSPNLLAE